MGKAQGHIANVRKNWERDPDLSSLICSVFLLRHASSQGLHKTWEIELDKLDKREDLLYHFAIMFSSKELGQKSVFNI